MIRYTVPELLALSVDELWALPNVRHVVEFADGELETYGRATILSVYYWRALRNFPKTPVLKDWHVESIGFDSSKMITSIGRVIWGIHDHYESIGEPISIDELAYNTMDTVMDIYNDFTVRVSNYVTTFSLFDVMEIMDHPEIRAANESVKMTQHSIEKVTHKKVAEVLRDKTQFQGNHIALGVRLGTTSMGQMLQCVSIRGYCTDIDSSIFHTPIMSGYVEGITGLYEAMTESRSGAKAQGYSKELIRDTETFNRRLQLIAQTLTTLHYHTDCGTDITLEFLVKKDNLKQLAGKYYILPNGSLGVIKGDEKHLIDTNIRIRSVLGCKHPDPTGICSTCYGKLASSVPYGTNIGHVSATEFCDIVTSNVLATKHLDSTSQVDEFQLGRIERQYLHTKPDIDAIFLNANKHKHQIKITLASEEAASISDLLLVKDIAALIPERMTSISQLMVEVTDDKGNTKRDILHVSQYNRQSFLTTAALKYIQHHGWEYTDDQRRDIVIDITKFGDNKPLFELPFTHVNMLEYKNETEAFLSSSRTAQRARFRANGRPVRRVEKTQTVLSDFDNMSSALMAFANKASDKISVNIVHREILMYVFMARDPEARDYRLPIPATSGVFCKRSDIFAGRSLAPMMAHQDQISGVMSVEPFLVRHRNDSPFDAILTGGTQYNR